MFNFKWKKVEEKKQEEKRQVKCETCKHYIDEEDAQIIPLYTLFFSVFQRFYYCPLHRVKYDYVVYGNSDGTRFFKGRKITDNERINEDGTPYKEPKKK